VRLDFIFDMHLTANLPRNLGKSSSEKNSEIGYELTELWA